jgi:hypothetical protein
MINWLLFASVWLNVVLAVLVVYHRILVKHNERLANEVKGALKKALTEASIGIRDRDGSG